MLIAAHKELEQRTRSGLAQATARAAEAAAKADKPVDVSSTSHLRDLAASAARVFGWPLTGITRRLRQNPTEIQKLTGFRQAIDQVPRLGIEVLPIDRHLPPLAAALSQVHGLLTNDALIVATMQDQAIKHIASHDPDFDRVPGIMRYAPA